MKNKSCCPIHGDRPRPELCNDCGRQPRGARRLLIQDVDRNRILLRRFSPAGRIRAEVIGEPLDLSLVSPYWD